MPMKVELELESLARALLDEDHNIGQVLTGAEMALASLRIGVPVYTVMADEQALGFIKLEGAWHLAVEKKGRWWSVKGLDRDTRSLVAAALPRLLGDAVQQIKDRIVQRRQALETLTVTTETIQQWVRDNPR